MHRGVGKRFGRAGPRPTCIARGDAHLCVVDRLRRRTQFPHDDSESGQTGVGSRIGSGDDDGADNLAPIGRLEGDATRWKPECTGNKKQWI